MIRKRIVLSVAGIVCACIIIACYIEITNCKQVWIESIDENGEIMEVLDMSEAEIQEYEVSQLQKKYKSLLSPKSWIYDYEFERIKTVYDSGDNTTNKILIGQSNNWSQSSRIFTTNRITFQLDNICCDLTGKSKMSTSTKEYYDTDNRYDSCLGLFARVVISEYQITQKNIMNGDVLTVTSDNVMTIYSKSVAPIYYAGNNTDIISYYYENEWQIATVVNPDILEVSTNS